jgi:ribonuclease HII
MPSFRYEMRCEGERGSIRIAGIDEVGRGPLAGPVMAAVAVIDRTLAKRKLLRLIDDSKKLALEDREKAYDAMIASGAVRFAVGEASVVEIDTINILQATLLAMRRAVEALPVAPHEAIVDGNQTPRLACPVHAIVKGDRDVASISAASILAKTARDALMRELDATYPAYGFAHNKGYGTPDHLAALDRFGPCAIHRRSFAPVLQISLPF